MQKNLYIVRHCKATGQSPESPLTEIGFVQADHLNDYFQGITIDRIVSSPYLRAVQTVEPISLNKEIPIEIDERLSERVLSTKDLPDWMPKLKETFIDLDAKFEGGESSHEAMQRITNVVNELVESHVENSLIVSHGNIISLLLKNYNPEFDFDGWKTMSNPDVFKVTLYEEDRFTMERIWDEGRSYD